MGRALAGMQMEMAFGKQIHLAANWRQISQVQSCHTSCHFSSPSLSLSFILPNLPLSLSLCLCCTTLSSYGGRQVQLQEKRITCAIILLLSCRVYLLFCCCFACSTLYSPLPHTLPPLPHTLPHTLPLFLPLPLSLHSCLPLDQIHLKRKPTTFFFFFLGGFKTCAQWGKCLQNVLHLQFGTGCATLQGARTEQHCNRNTGSIVSRVSLSLSLSSAVSGQTAEMVRETRKGTQGRGRRREREGGGGGREEQK